MKHKLNEARLEQVGKLFIITFLESMISNSKKDKISVYRSAASTLIKAFNEIDEYKNLNYAAQVTHMLQHLKEDPAPIELKAWKNYIFCRNNNEVSKEATELSIKTWMDTKQAQKMLDIIYSEALKAEGARKHMEETGCSAEEALKHFNIIDLRVSNKKESTGRNHRRVQLKRLEEQFRRLREVQNNHGVRQSKVHEHR